MNIVKCHPFDGKPVFHLPTVFGAATGKEFLFSIPVTGKQPITLTAENLPEGLSLSDRVLSGKIEKDADYSLTFTAQNDEGTASASLTLRVREGLSLLTPLVGFCSWSAFGSRVTQADIERSADQLVECGLADYGFSHVNLDSGWQGVYGGKHDAIAPNAKFPDMKKMTDHIHRCGLKAGIYSTPMLTAWGCPEEFASIPGCTVGEPDLRFTWYNGGVGKEHREENNVRQWDEWGFDYLKYDWAPTEPVNADLMKQALNKASRHFSFCVTVRASEAYGPYWRENCNSWRDNEDSIDEWDNLKRRSYTVDVWKKYVCPGHFYDLDMLEIGRNAFYDGENRLSEDELLFSYTLRAFFLSPIQISTPLDRLNDFEKDILCNEEMLRLHRDALCDYPTRIVGGEHDALRVYRRTLENGDCAVAVFNTSDEEQNGKILLENARPVLDVWTGEKSEKTNVLTYRAAAHGVAVYRILYSE